jgi:hypothetical protein
MAIGNIQAGTPARLTSSGVVKAEQGVLIGAVIASSSSLTIKLWDNATAGSGTVLLDTTAAITAPAYLPLPISFANGCYATIGGTGSVTFIYA